MEREWEDAIKNLQLHPDAIVRVVDGAIEMARAWRHKKFRCSISQIEKNLLYANQITPLHPWLLNELGVFYLEDKGLAHEALPYLKELSEHFNLQDGSRILYAQALLATGDLKTAEAIWQPVEGRAHNKAWVGDCINILKNDQTQWQGPAPREVFFKFLRDRLANLLKNDEQLSLSDIQKIAKIARSAKGDTKNFVINNLDFFEAQLAEQTGELDQAGNRLEQLVGREPRVKYRLALAHNLILRQEYDEAITQAELVLKSDRNSYSAYRIMGHSYKAQFNLSKAVESYQIGLKLLGDRRINSSDTRQIIENLADIYRRINPKAGIQLIR